jgi:hypothetical protein
MPTKKKAAPAKAAPPKKRMGYLVCDDCSKTVQCMEGSDWPQHRCGYDVRPFTRWQEGADPARMPLSPYEVESTPIPPYYQEPKP